MRKAKNCKILIKKQPNYIIAAELKVGRFFLTDAVRMFGTAEKWHLSNIPKKIVQ